VIEPAEWLGGAQVARYPLHLVSSQPRDKLHSQMGAGPVSARGKTAGRETLAISPVDARDRRTSRLSQGPSSATALVQVERCAAPPPVRAFTTLHLQGA